MNTEIKIDCSYDELVQVSKLKPHPKNNNKHSKEQIERLCKIIEYQGFRQAIVVSTLSGVITKGHGRLMVAKKLGMTKVPVDYQNYQDESQEYADLTADNEIARWAELDVDSILENADLLKGLDLDVLGIKDFDIPDIEDIIGERVEHRDMVTRNEEADNDDVVPEVKQDERIKTKHGDIWILGNHRLMCGDSIKIDDVKRLMADQAAQMVFTDPPYNVAFNGRSGSFEVIKNDDLSDADFDVFIDEVTKVIGWLNPESYYVWCNWKFYATLQTKLDFKSCIVWAKNVFGMGNGYRHQHEFCLFNGKIDEDIKNESDLWNIKKDHSYVHPTQKPTALAERALSNHKKARIIVDLFLGSGSTLIACEKLSRQCYGMELDEKYCDVIIRRWQEYTGKRAILESSGECYDNI